MEGCVEKVLIIFVVGSLPTQSLYMAPQYIMNNGLEIPALALGTYLGYDHQIGPIKSINKQLKLVIEQAIDIGYRHIDTASCYNTEEEIGEGINSKISDGTVSRDELFVTTKLWNTDHRSEQVLLALRESLKRLKLDYVDLYLIHWPMGLNTDYTYSSVDFMETWRGMEEVHKLGLAKSIGLSNFNRTQLARVINEGRVKPQVLQIEIHPQLVQSELVEYAQSRDIVVMGYSPFGSLVRRYGIDFPGPKVTDANMVTIAKKYGKSVPQIVLAWLANRKIIPVAKTVSPERLAENIDIFNVNLTRQEISTIESYNSNTRYTLPSFWQDHMFYPFERNEKAVENPFA